jgi:hypothetical protein
MFLVAFLHETNLNRSLQVTAKNKIPGYFVVICLWKEG